MVAHPLMNKLIVSSIIALLVGLSASQLAQAQGTLYFSTLGLTSSGSAHVGSDSWLAADFDTGTNAGGYLLNSVQLALGDASGNPHSLTAMIYADSNIPVGDYLGHNMGTLSGSLDPVTAGIYTFSPVTSLTLLPRTEYFLVLTAGTAVTAGSYEWDYSTTFNPSRAGGWGGGNWLLVSEDGVYESSLLRGQYAQFAVSATDLPVPEPSTIALLTLGGLIFVWHRQKPKVF
jgi:hypothetical protein